jgi:hypothetical protein
MIKEFDQAKYVLSGFLKANSALLWELPLLSVILNTKAALKDHKSPQSVLVHTGVAVLSLIAAARGFEQADQIEKKKNTRRQQLADINNSPKFRQIFFGES